MSPRQSSSRRTLKSHAPKPYSTRLGPPLSGRSEQSSRARIFIARLYREHAFRVTLCPHKQLETYPEEKRGRKARCEVDRGTGERWARAPQPGARTRVRQKSQNCLIHKTIRSKQNQIPQEFRIRYFRQRGFHRQMLRYSRHCISNGSIKFGT